VCVGGLGRSLDGERLAGFGTAGRALKGGRGTRRGLLAPAIAARERGDRGYLRACLVPIGLPKLPRSQFAGRVFSAIFQN